MKGEGEDEQQEEDSGAVGRNGKEIKFNDGKSVLDRFNEQESERANELRKAFEWDR